MIIFLYGPDDFRRDEKKKFTIEEFKKKHSAIALGFFDLLKEDQLLLFTEFIRAQSIFENSKLAVIEDAFEEPVLEDKLVKELKGVVNDKKLTVLFSERKLPTKKLNFLILQPSISQKFENLSGSEWQNFIIAESRKLGMSLEPGALALLSNVYQNNTWGLVTELQKLGNLGHLRITELDLEKLSLESVPNYWAVLNGLNNRNISSRLSALHELLSKNEPPPKIFNILASQWREKASEMASYDLMVKSGKLEYEEALVDLII